MFEESFQFEILKTPYVNKIRTRNQKVRESVRPSFLKFPSICKIVEETEERNEETSRSQFHILSFETNSLNKNNTIRETPLLSPPYAIRI